MGQGTTLTLINGTPYNWTIGHDTPEPYQMNCWSFPASVPANSCSSNTYVEWSEGAGQTHSDDQAIVQYGIDGTSSSFQIHATWVDGGPKLEIHLTGMSTLSDSQGNAQSLPYTWNKTSWPSYNATTLIVAGVDGNFICNSTNTLRQPWLQKSLPMIGGRNLRNICMPAAHDSGMSMISAHTAFGIDANCCTQSNDVGTQLAYGVRFLDIRPVISGGDYWTGHYSNTNHWPLGWQGACGQKLSDIINQINSFTSNFPELVVVQISHDLDTDNGYGHFTTDQWTGCFNQLANLQQLYTPPSGTSDLTFLTLNQFIGNGHAAVVVVFDVGDDLSLGAKQGQGFFHQSQFPTYDAWSNADNPNDVMSTQEAKLVDQRRDPNSQVFSLDWTETQYNADAEKNVVGLGSSILDLAAQINPRLAPLFLPKCSKTVYPNLLSTDDIKNTLPVAVAMAINVLITT